MLITPTDFAVAMFGALCLGALVGWALARPGRRKSRPW